MPRPEFQYKEIHNGSTRHPVLRHLLQEAVNQDERYFSSYIPPARDAIIILPKHVLYILIGLVMIIAGTYGITGHLIKDLAHDLADWLLGPDLKENEEEDEVVVESSGQEDRAEERKAGEKNSHRSTSGDKNSPGVQLSLTA